MDTAGWGEAGGRAEVSTNTVSCQRSGRVLLRPVLSSRIISKKLVKDHLSEVMDEINVLKKLDHPHIVHVWDNFESRDK